MDVISAFTCNRFGVIIPSGLHYKKYEISLLEYDAKWFPAILNANFCKFKWKVIFFYFFYFVNRKVVERKEKMLFVIFLMNKCKEEIRTHRYGKLIQSTYTTWHLS